MTAFELEALGIPHAVIVDSAAASLMAAGEVDIVITGADRIAANGDTPTRSGPTASPCSPATTRSLRDRGADLDDRPGDRNRSRDPDRGARRQPR